METSSIEDSFHGIYTERSKGKLGFGRDIHGEDVIMFCSLNKSNCSRNYYVVRNGATSSTTCHAMISFYTALGGSIPPEIKVRAFGQSLKHSDQVVVEGSKWEKQ